MKQIKSFFKKKSLKLDPHNSTPTPTCANKCEGIAAPTPLCNSSRPSLLDSYCCKHGGVFLLESFCELQCAENYVLTLLESYNGFLAGRTSWQFTVLSLECMPIVVLVYRCTLIEFVIMQQAGTVLSGHALSLYCSMLSC